MGLKQKLPPERRKKLRALARLMNEQNDPSVFVTDELLAVFECVITPEETDYLLAFGTAPHTRDEAAGLLAGEPDRFDAFFEGLLRKGLVWMRRDRSGNETYSLAPILVGWFEVYLLNGRQTPEQQEFARRLDALFRYWKRYNVFPVRGIRNFTSRFSKPTQRVVPGADTAGAKTRTIAIDDSITVPPAGIYSTGDIMDLIDRYGKEHAIALVYCFCREWRTMVGEPCSFKLPRRSCIAIGQFAEHAVRYNDGKYISDAEAREIVTGLRDLGAVHMVFHEREDLSLPELGICNCCWDCCGVIGSYNRGITGLHFRAYYLAEISDLNACTHCGRCARFCPVNAISVDKESIAIDTRTCIGCGQCAVQCKKYAVRLTPLERDVYLPLLKPSEARIRP